LQTTTYNKDEQNLRQHIAPPGGGDKMNQIQTLDHHGRKRHVKAKTALLQNGTIPPGSKVIEYGNEVDSTEPEIKNKNDTDDSLTNDSQQDDFSFTLPKPQNIAPHSKVFKL